MKGIQLHIALGLLLIAGGCQLPFRRQINQEPTFWRRDKIPYGTYVAFEGLSRIFPHTPVDVNRYSPLDDRFNPLDSNGHRPRLAYLVISPRFDPDPREVNEILDLVGNGHQVLISSFSFGDSLSAALKISSSFSFPVPEWVDSNRVSVVDPLSFDSAYYRYPGLSYPAYFTKLDTEYSVVLGRTGRGEKPNFIRFAYKGGGALFLHLDPFAFTNFFLLHKQNIGYYERVMSYFPASIDRVLWDDYFRTRSGEFSAFRFLMSQRGLRWALILLALLFAILYLVESKRRQRIIPPRPPVGNDSLDFVRTIGRLYYQRRDNRNLAEKMSAHLLDSIRTRYQLSTGTLDQTFMERLSAKSAYDLSKTASLISLARDLPEQGSVSDQLLLEFSQLIDDFFKHAY